MISCLSVRRTVSLVSAIHHCLLLHKIQTVLLLPGAAGLNGVARRSQSLRLGQTDFVMINESGVSASEGRGLNKDKRVMIDMLGTETNLLIQPQVSFYFLHWSRLMCNIRKIS